MVLLSAAPGIQQRFQSTEMLQDGLVLWIDRRHVPQGTGRSGHDVPISTLIQLHQLINDDGLSANAANALVILTDRGIDTIQTKAIQNVILIFNTVGYLFVSFSQCCWLEWTRFVHLIPGMTHDFLRQPYQHFYVRWWRYVGKSFDVAKDIVVEEGYGTLLIFFKCVDGSIHGVFCNDSAILRQLTHDATAVKKNFVSWWLVNENLYCCVLLLNCGVLMTVVDKGGM